MRFLVTPIASARSTCHISGMADAAMEGLPARYWHQLDDGRVQCDLCPRYCRLQEGQRGLCFVRARSRGRLVLTTHGRSSGFCVDPIEKKPLNHFLPGTPVLSFGTAGCNLTCKFCQNWDISKSRAFDRLTEHASPDAIARAAERHGCRSVAYTYNDPVIFLEYAVEVARACRARGIKNVAVSAGYICAEPRDEFFRHMDAVNIDLKAFTQSFYRKLCSGSLQPVLETLIHIRHHTDAWLEITTLLIPGRNDSSEEVERLSAWVLKQLGPDVPLHFSAFHPDWKMMETPRTPARTLLTARDIALRAGLRYVYTGNISDPESQSTYCHHCKTKLIGRDWYHLDNWKLDQGCCAHCGTACAGVLEQRPGTWGRKRLPITLSA